MHPYPHTYRASASSDRTGVVAVTSPQLPTLATAAPPQFDGPAGVWSPETLLCASLADCFVLTFRAVARAANLDWLHLECRVEGVLERVAQRSEFTRYTTIATLTVLAGVDSAQAHQLLERAEKGCLIANSVRGERVLKAEIISANPASTSQVAQPAQLVS